MNAVQHFTLKSGAQNQNINVFLADMSADANNGLGLAGLADTDIDSAGYMREGASAAVAITPVAGTVGTFTSSGFKEIDATNMIGWYQFSVPNACLANGAKWVDIDLGFLTADNTGCRIHIDLIRSVAW